MINKFINVFNLVIYLRLLTDRQIVCGVFNIGGCRTKYIRPCQLV